MKRLAALAALAGSSVALADLSFIDVKLRPWGSSGPWSDAQTLQSSNLIDPISVEVGVFYHFTTGVGLSTVIHSITGSPYSAVLGDQAVILDNPTSVQHPDGRVGAFNDGGRRQRVYHSGASGVDANRFRIADDVNSGDILPGGLFIQQKPPSIVGTSLDTSNPAFAYHFKLTLACSNGGAPRTVTINAPDDRIASFLTFASLGSTSGDSEPPLGPSDPASVTVSWAPAPASATVFAAAILWTRRRARR